MLPAATCGSPACSFLLRPSPVLLPARRASCGSGVHRSIPLVGIDAAWEATVLFKTALALLVTWGLGIAGVYAVGQMVHVLLLVGLMLLLLSFAKSHDSAVRRQGPRTDR